MALPLLIAGGLMQMGGGLMQGRARSRAAQQAAELAMFNPYAINGAGGNVFTDRWGALNVEGDEQTQMFQNLFGQHAQQALTNGFGQGAIDFASGAGSQALGSAFMDAFGNSSDPTSAINAGNMFSDFSNANALFGQQQGANLLGMAQDFGSRQTGVNEGLAQSLFGRAEQAFGLGERDQFQDLSNQQLERMRSLARPAEERAVNSKFQNLFSRGTLSATPGHQQLGELAGVQERADTERMIAADNFGNMLAQQNRQYGQGLMGLGMNARGMDQQFNLGAANLFGGLGQGMMTFGQNAAGQGFQTQLGLNELMNSRGQQRLLNASQLLGLGGGLQNQNLNQSLGLFGALRGINADQRALMALSGNLGSERALAGARAGGFLTDGAFSMGGSLMAGIGSGMAGWASGGASGLAGAFGGGQS